MREPAPEGAGLELLGVSAPRLPRRGALRVEHVRLDQNVTSARDAVLGQEGGRDLRLERVLLPLLDPTSGPAADHDDPLVFAERVVNQHAMHAVEAALLG